MFNFINIIKTICVYSVTVLTLIVTFIALFTSEFLCQILVPLPWLIIFFTICILSIFVLVKELIKSEKNKEKTEIIEINSDNHKTIIWFKVNYFIPQGCLVNIIQKFDNKTYTSIAFGYVEYKQEENIIGITILEELKKDTINEKTKPQISFNKIIPLEELMKLSTQLSQELESLSKYKRGTQ